MRGFQSGATAGQSRSISIIVSALVCFVLVAADIHVMLVRLVAGCALCFFLPGLALADRLGNPQVRDWSSLLLCSVGFSVVLTIVSGFVLFGVSAATPTSLSAVLAAFAVAFAVLTARRRTGARLPLSRPDRRSTVAAGFVAVIALGVCAAAVAVAYEAERADDGGGFTTLGITGPSDATNYRVTVTSYEKRTSSYIVSEVTSSGKTPLRHFVLKPGASDSLSMSIAPTAGTVRVVLMRDGSPQWYRWLSIGPTKPA
jgi:uncharacterized membrane protein